MDSRSRERVMSVYRNQLYTFKKLGIGGVTQYDTTVTQALIDITQKRLTELYMQSCGRNGKKI
tara:strand:+ start:716 stop:904 length:189 start_codon:yes stop_codon:yes gene_type:complete